MCCRLGSGTIKRLLYGDAPEGVPDEFDKVADNYWGLVINDGLKQLDGIGSLREKHASKYCKKQIERLLLKVNDCLELNDYSGKKGPKRDPKAKNAATEESSVAAFGV